jgi:hypothetical protein
VRYSEGDISINLYTKMENNMNKRYLLFGTLVLIAVLSISAFSSGPESEFNVDQDGQADHLTEFDPGDISAFRWNAMADYYAGQNGEQSVLFSDLTTFDAAEIVAYRWNAMADYYAGQNGEKSVLISDLTTFDAVQDDFLRDETYPSISSD